MPANLYALRKSNFDVRRRSSEKLKSRYNGRSTRRDKSCSQENLNCARLRLVCKENSHRLMTSTVITKSVSVLVVSLLKIVTSVASKRECVVSMVL